MIATARCKLTDGEFELSHWPRVRSFLHRELARDPGGFAVVFGPAWQNLAAVLTDSSVERLLEVIMGKTVGTEREQKFLCHVGKSIYFSSCLQEAKFDRFKEEAVATGLN